LAGYQLGPYVTRNGPRSRVVIAMQHRALRTDILATGRAEVVCQDWITGLVRRWLLARVDRVVMQASEKPSDPDVSSCSNARVQMGELLDYLIGASKEH